MSLTKLENIPVIMRANGWLNGARLMEQWFSRPVSIKPAYGPPETTTIKMDSWLLTFPRGRKAYQNILDKKIWVSEGAQKVLANQLRKSGVLSVHQTAQWSFGDLGLSAEKLHDKHINHEAVSEFLLPTLDDMTAALANFSLYVAVAGFVRKASTRQTSQPGARWSHSTGWPGFEVTVTEVAIWMMDSYDFEGNQSLGWWDEEHNSVAVSPKFEEKYIEPGVAPAGPKYTYTEVTNETFRQWRLKNNKGGDFRVFSDVKRVKLAKPDELFLA